MSQAWNPGRTPEVHNSDELKQKDVSVAKQTKKAVGEKKKKGRHFKHPGLPKPLLFSIAPQDVLEVF